MQVICCRNKIEFLGAIEFEPKSNDLFEGIGFPNGITRKQYQNKHRE